MSVTAPRIQMVRLLLETKWCVFQMFSDGKNFNAIMKRYKTILIPGVFAQVSNCKITFDYREISVGF
jgi:hypothetical protein